MQSNDMHPETEKILVRLIRSSSVARRLSRMNSLSSTVISLSRRAIVRANPHFSEKKAELRFIELHYGADLARKLEKRLPDE